MIETAAEVGDGVVFNLWPMGALPKMVEHVKIGAERAGKNGDEVEIVNRHMVLVTDDKESARARFRAGFAPYYATPVYNAFLAWAGYEDEAAIIREGWAERDREKTTGAIVGPASSSVRPPLRRMRSGSAVVRSGEICCQLWPPFVVRCTNWLPT